MNNQDKEPIMTNDIPTPDLSSLPLVMVRDKYSQGWQGPHRLTNCKSRDEFGRGCNRDYRSELEKALGGGKESEG